MNVYTLRLDGEPRPFLWVLDEGPQTEALLNRTIKQCVARGETVIVGLVRHQPRVKEVTHG